MQVRRPWNTDSERSRNDALYAAGTAIRKHDAIKHGEFLLAGLPTCGDAGSPNAGGLDVSGSNDFLHLARIIKAQKAVSLILDARRMRGFDTYIPIGHAQCLSGKLRSRCLVPQQPHILLLRNGLRSTGFRQEKDQCSMHAVADSRKPVRFYIWKCGRSIHSVSGLRDFALLLKPLQWATFATLPPLKVGRRKPISAGGVKAARNLRPQFFARIELPRQRLRQSTDHSSS